MAIKTSDLLNGIPSVSELLEKPPVRALTERLNRTVVAAGVRSFLDQLKTDLQRRAANAQLPSIRELAERAARHVVALQQQSQRPAINASGYILGTAWSSGPLAETSLERAFAIGRDFVAAAEQSSDPMVDANTGVTAELCRLTRAPAVAVVHSYASAVWITLSTIAAGHEVVLSRSDFGDAETGCPLAQLGAGANAVFKEVGTTNRVTATDYEGAVLPQTAALLRFAPDDYCVTGETESAELEELVALARERELVLIDALGAAPLAELPAAIPYPRRSAKASLAAGVDLVLLRGDGLVGGPACGLILGRRDVVQRIVEHPLFAACELDRLRAAMLAATLECHESSSQGEPSLPLWQLLSAPVENLRNRAERIAPQLSIAQGVAAAEPVAMSSPLTAAYLPTSCLSSYGISLTPSDGNVEALANRLRVTTQPVVGRVEQSRLLLDLRTVFPRQDQALIEGILGSKSAELNS